MATVGDTDGCARGDAYTECRHHQHDQHERGEVGAVRLVALAKLDECVVLTFGEHGV